MRSFPDPGLRRPGRQLLAGVALSAAVTLGALSAGSANAAPRRVPPWPTVTSSIPASLIKPATTTTSDYEQKLDNRLDRRVRSGALGSNVAVRVEDLATGHIDYRYRSGAALVPASTMKTATALAVLSARGPDHMLATTVVRSPDGQGLTLVGGGDPVLTAKNLDELAKSVAEELRSDGDAGIKFRVAYDDSLFAQPGLPPGWPSSYVGDYSANPTALTRYGSFSRDSARDTAHYFRTRLKAHGLRATAGVRHQEAPDAATPVATFEGHTIAEALWPMLQNSDNTIAEIMIRHVALARGDATTSGGSAASVRAELRTLGIPVGNMSAVDGSGLSRSDRVSTKTLVAITRAAMDPDNSGLATGFRYSAFPLAGVSGTLEDRFKDRRTSCAAGRIMAKTGTLSDTLALSGITSSTDGRLRAFAILVNNKPSWASLDSARYRVDRIAAAITGCR